MVGRVPCGVCNLQVSTPNNFLLVCSCGIACHHTCFKPPMAQSSLLAMIYAFNRGVHEKSIRSWRCAVCTSTTSVPQSPFSAKSSPYINTGVRDYNPAPPDQKTIDGAPAPPKPSQSRPRIDSPRRDVQYVSNANHPGRNDKNVVDGHVHGWRKNALTPLKLPQSNLHIGPRAAAWPPVRHKNKNKQHTHPAAVENIGEPTSLNVKVASTKQAESADTVKRAFSRSRSPASKGLRPNPMPDSSTSFLEASANRNPHAPKLRKAADGSLLCPPGRSMLVQTIKRSNNGRTTYPAIRNGVVNRSHTGDDISKMNINTLPKRDDIDDVFIDSHLENDADSKNKIVTQITFPVLPINTRGLHDLPSSPTALGRPDKRKGAAMLSISGEEASNTPFASTPLQRTPPLVDLQKALERKRSTVRRNASVPSIGSNLNAPGLKWQAIGVSTQDSGSDLYPPLKRRKLDQGNTQKPEEQTSGGKADVATQERNPVPVAKGEHVKPVDSPLPPHVQTNEQAQKSLPTNAAKSMTRNVQLSQTTELSSPQLYSSETGAETRHDTVDHHVNGENKQLCQLASPATSHRSFEALPQDDSPAPAAKPGSPPATVLSPPEKFLHIHDQTVTESHLPSISIPTPRSLSPARHPIIRNVLDNVVARLQLQPRRPDHMRSSRYPESKVKLPRLARWFKEIGTNLVTTGTRDKRKRWKAPNPKELMVGSSAGWSFVGAHVRTT